VKHGLYLVQLLEKVLGGRTSQCARQDSRVAGGGQWIFSFYKIKNE